MSFAATLSLPPHDTLALTKRLKAAGASLRRAARHLDELCPALLRERFQEADRRATEALDEIDRALEQVLSYCDRPAEFDGPKAA